MIEAKLNPNLKVVSTKFLDQTIHYTHEIRFYTLELPLVVLPSRSPTLFNPEEAIPSFLFPPFSIFLPQAHSSPYSYRYGAPYGIDVSRPRENEVRRQATGE